LIDVINETVVLRLLRVVPGLGAHQRLDLSVTLAGSSMGGNQRDPYPVEQVGHLPHVCGAAEAKGCGLCIIRNELPSRVFPLRP
jgi:hypothetical protein